jgi:hypothetical protein
MAGLKLISHPLALQPRQHAAPSAQPCNQKRIAIRHYESTSIRQVDFIRSSI